MNKNLRTFFQANSILRLVCIAVFFIIDRFRQYNIGDPDGGYLSDLVLMESGPDFIAYVIFLVYAVNTIISFLLSFRPQVFLKHSSSHQNVILGILYGGELLIAPVFLYLAYEAIPEAFFPTGHESLFTEILEMIGPSDILVYEKWDAVNFGLLGLSSIMFGLLFWSFYTARKKTFNATAT